MKNEKKKLIYAKARSHIKVLCFSHSVFCAAHDADDMNPQYPTKMTWHRAIHEISFSTTQNVFAKIFAHFITVCFTVFVLLLLLLPKNHKKRVLNSFQFYTRRISSFHHFISPKRSWNSTLKNHSFHASLIFLT